MGRNHFNGRDGDRISAAVVAAGYYARSLSNDAVGKANFLTLSR